MCTAHFIKEQTGPGVSRGNQPGVSGLRGHRLSLALQGGPLDLRPASLSPLAGVHPAGLLTHRGQHPFPDSGRAGLRRAASAMGGLGGQVRGLVCGSPRPRARPARPLTCFPTPTATAQLTRSCGPSQPWRCRSDGMSSPSCSSCSPGRCWSPCGTRAPSRPCSLRARVSPALPGFADGETAACGPESPDGVTPAWRPESPLLSQRGTGDDLADYRTLGG